MTTFVSDTSLTLAGRLSEGRLAVSEALRYAMILAEALRRLHESGNTHGGVSPAAIAVTATGLELLPPSSADGPVTPYTAPEVLEGRPADARSDIFSFGAVLYEMLTGRRAFASEDSSAVAAALSTAAPLPSGSPAVDRLVLACVAKDPARRLQRIQRILLELKLLSVVARRADASAVSRREQAETALRAEMQRFEARVASRLDEFENAVAEMQRTTAQALAKLHEELSAVSAQLGSAHERLARAEQNLAAAHEAGETLQASVAADLQDVAQMLKSHDVAIESARTAMAQTDDLMERVVEALELLQSSVIEQGGGPVPAN